MLKGYEITEDLTTHERAEVLPLIVAGLRSKVGASKAVAGSYICDTLNGSGRLKDYKLNPVKLRKLIQTIRLESILFGVCSSSKGYYLAEGVQELSECIESLKQRIRQQQRVVDALDFQREKLKGLEMLKGL